jgi:hypothetical protein
MTPDDLRQQIELTIVEFIKKALGAGTMTEERAQQISQVVLDTVKPGMGFDELYKAIPRLDDTCQEISPVILPYLKQYEENVNKKALEEISNLIKMGEYDAATSLGKKVVNQEVELVWQGSGNPSAPKKASQDHVFAENGSNVDRNPTNVEATGDKTAGKPSSALTDAMAGKQELGDENKQVDNQNQDVSPLQKDLVAQLDDLSAKDLATGENQNSVMPDPMTVTPRNSDVANVVSTMPVASVQMIPSDDLLPDPFGTTPLI